MSDRPESHHVGWVEQALHRHLTGKWTRQTLIEHLRESHPEVTALDDDYAVSTMIGVYNLALLRMWHEAEHQHSVPATQTKENPS